MCGDVGMLGDRKVSGDKNASLQSPTSGTVTQGDKLPKDDRGGVILQSSVEHTYVQQRQ